MRETEEQFYTRVMGKEFWDRRVENRKRREQLDLEWEQWEQAFCVLPGLLTCCILGVILLGSGVLWLIRLMVIE